MVTYAIRIKDRQTGKILIIKRQNLFKRQGK